MTTKITLYNILNTCRLAFIFLLFVSVSCTEEIDDVLPTSELSFNSFDSKSGECIFNVYVAENAGIKSVKLYKGDTLFYDYAVTTRAEVKQDLKLDARCKFSKPGFQFRAVISDFAENITEKTLDFYPTISIQKPTELTQWQPNTAQEIAWAGNFSGNLKIDLYKGTVFYRTISTISPANGKFVLTWNAPSYLPAGIDYRVRVSSVAMPSIEIFSKPFTVLPVFTINTKVDGLSFIAGNKINLQWTDNVTENLKIELWKGGVLSHTISESTPNTMVEWLIPTIISAGSDYKIRFSVVGMSNYYIETGYFSISPSIVSGTVTDVDGNVYKTITIGHQTWMVDNLRTTKFNDGTNIPNVTSNSAWAATISPAYCWQNNDISNTKFNYGALYNWSAVSSGKLAPVGWHVPNYDEWNTLISFLGGETVAAGKLKEAGYDHWLSPNPGATNESRFNALPAGTRDVGGNFSGVGYSASFWTSNQYNNQFAYLTNLENTSSKVNRYYMYSKMGLSVRCIKN